MADALASLFDAKALIIVVAGTWLATLARCGWLDMAAAIRALGQLYGPVFDANANRAAMASVPEPVAVVDAAVMGFVVSITCGGGTGAGFEPGSGPQPQRTAAAAKAPLWSAKRNIAFNLAPTTSSDKNGHGPPKPFPGQRRTQITHKKNLF